LFSSDTTYLPFRSFSFPAAASVKPNGRAAVAITLRAVGLWYWLGVSLGLGVALGIAIGALLGPFRGGCVLSALAAAGGGYALAAFFYLGLVAALVGAVGGIVGGLGSAVLARRTLKRGGTRGATTILLIVVALIAAGLAFVPVAGYIETALVGILTLRLSRGGGDRFAGLRTLARD